MGGIGVGVGRCSGGIHNHSLFLFVLGKGRFYCLVLSALFIIYLFSFRYPFKLVHVLASFSSLYLDMDISNCVVCIALLSPFPSFLFYLF